MAMLKQGSHGPQVKKLQSKLELLGFDPGIIDGRFGGATKTALVAFQKSKGLTPDGIAGPITQNALEKSPEITSTALGANSNKIAIDVTTSNTKPRLLTESDFVMASKLLKCDIAAIKAVAEVESAGNGFLSDGRLKVLFEGHQFYKFTKGAYARTHPTLCFKKWTRKHYAKGANAQMRGAGELARLERAIGLNRSAALMSASYGKFQIMGFNFAVCGFGNVEEFYNAMQLGEGEQLKAFCSYIIGNAIDDELRNHQWAAFAKRYNGAEYWKNKYDTKLAAAHAKYSKD